MYYIVVTHLRGSKADQVEEFPLRLYKEVIVGRDVTANVRFADTEIMVGRQHLKLTPDPDNPAQILLTDLSSRNGTFLNHHRVVGTVALNPGDIVQCGLNGPEFQFDLQPETRPLESGPAPTQPFNVFPPRKPAAPVAFSPLAHLATSGPEQPPEPEMEAPAVAEPKTGRSGKPWLIGAGALIALVVLAAGILGYRSLTATGGQETAKTAATPQPSANTVALKADPSPSPVAASEAEIEALRSAWQIDVSPYRTLSHGQPGAPEVDRPKGVAFSPRGLLYATDPTQRHVQVWDVRTGKHLGGFGHGVFGGEIADIAVAPDESIYITDQLLNLVYTFVPLQPDELNQPGRRIGPSDYQFKGTRFGEQKFEKLGAIAIDARGRIYLLDARRNEVRRFNPDQTLDQTFKFEQKRADGDTYLHGGEGIAIDETAGDLFIGSQQDAAVVVFDRETGAYKRRLLGAALDPAEKPAGRRVFSGSVDGLTVAHRHLVAVDESAGQIQLFDLDRPDAFNRDLVGYAAPQPNRPSGYQGFFGRGQHTGVEDRTELDPQRGGKAGPVHPNRSCSPDSIASYQDGASGETYLAVADPCHYRLAVYRWSDIGKALGQPTTIAEVKPSEAAPRRAPSKASAPAVRPPARVRVKVAPVRTRVVPHRGKRVVVIRHSNDKKKERKELEEREEKRKDKAKKN